MDQRPVYRLVASRLGQMSAPTAMDGDEDVIIVNSNSTRAVRRCASGAEISIRIARGLGTGALPSLPSSHSCLPRLLSLLLLIFIWHRETWAKGKDPPLLRVGCQRIHDSVRCFSEALMALARSLRRGYYHIWLHARVILAQEAVLVSRIN